MMPVRKVEFEILAKDRTAAALKTAGRGFTQAAERLKKFNAEVHESSDFSDELGDAFKKLAASALKVGVAGGKVAAGLAVITAAAGPLAVGINAATIATVKFGATVVSQMGPAAAAYVPVRLGILAVVQTLKAAGPAFVKAMEPLTAAWKEQSEQIGRVATKGLRPLAKEFVRVNFPAVKRTTEGIASAANTVAVRFAKWANTSRGVAALAKFGDALSATMQRLAPAVADTAIQFGEMVGRISGVSFEKAGDAAEWLLGRLKNLFMYLGDDEVRHAFDEIEATADKVAAGFRKIGEASQWLSDNSAEINKFADTMAAVGIVVGLATGGWLIALGGALSLLVRHWREVKAAAEEAGRFFERIGQQSSVANTLAAMANAFGDIKEGARSFVGTVRPLIEPFLDKLGDAFIRLQPLIAGATHVLGPLIGAFIKWQGVMTGGLLVGIGLLVDGLGYLAVGVMKTVRIVIDAFASMLAPLASAAKALGLPFADSLQGIVDDSREAADGIETSLNNVKTDLAQDEINDLQSEIDSLKGKTVVTDVDRARIKAAEARISELRGSINGLKSKTVTIRSNFVAHYSVTGDAGRYRSFNNGRVNQSAEFRAAGGPVRAGQPYIVGEKRPELFVPETNGRIMPTVPTGYGGGRASAGGVTYVVNLPNYLGDKRDLVRALDDLRRTGRLPRMA